jgi:UDP-N-acetyl-D-mannosaminuronate dehydrogenase
MKISTVIIGQGYVGLPLGMAAVRAGFNVLGIDIDSSKISIIRCHFN